VNAHAGNDLSDAVVELLSGIGLLVGDGEAPAGGGWQGPPAASRFIPYVDVHPIPGGISDGSIAEPNADSGALYQLIAVGANRAQAESIGDDVRQAMTEATFSLDGRHVTLLRLEMLGGATRDDSLRGNAVQPSVWLVSDRWRIYTTPAT
jgi:hypothetical protein